MRENKAMALLFPDTSRESLGALCDTRTAGSIPFGGRYRLIDFMLSNLVHAGIWDVGVVARDRYESLMNHLGSGRDWDLSRKYGGLTLLPPLVSDSGSAAYRGELESIFTYRTYIRDTPARYVVIADADLVGRIDLDKMIAQHAQSDATMTVAWQRIETAEEQGPGAVVFCMNENRVDRVTIGGRFKGSCCRYMGVIVIEKETLLNIVDEMAARNLFNIAQDLLQRGCSVSNIQGFEVTGCIKIQTLDGYYKSSMNLLQANTRRALFDPQFPVLTRVRDEAPVRYGLNAVVQNSLVADGCIIEGTVENSIIFRKVKVGAGAVIRDSIIMEGSEIGENAQLTCVVADRRCYISEGRIITGFTSYPVVIGKESVV